MLTFGLVVRGKDAKCREAVLNLVGARNCNILQAEWILI